MLDLLTAIFIDAVGLASPKSKEDTRRSLADARRRDHHQRQRHQAIDARIDAIVDSTMGGTDQVFEGLDPLYKHRLNHHRRAGGLKTVIA
jgi:hypothetical protein